MMEEKKEEGYYICPFCHRKIVAVSVCNCWEWKDHQKYGKLDASALRFVDSLFEYHRVKYALHVVEGVTLGDKEKEIADMDWAPVRETKKKVREKVRHIRMALADFIDEWEKIKDAEQDD